MHNSTAIKAVRELALLELSLVECSGLADNLIVPGSFSALRKLHIVEPIPQLRRCLHMKETLTLALIQEAAADNDPLAEAIISLPSLVELTGLI